MKKYRINTIISQKHHAILKEYAEEYGTQKSVLENALESLKNNSNQSIGLPPEEEELWLRLGRELKDILLVFPRDFIKILYETADVEQFTKYIKNERPAEFAVEWYYNKPLKDCTLQEVVTAIIINMKVHGSFDSLIYKEDEISHDINLTHSLGFNASKMLEMMNRSVFDSYGVEFESYCSERSVFFKVFKSDDDLTELE